MGTIFEEAIRARFKQGFGEWNKGYEEWLKWCDTLYEPDAYYNFFGERHTLQEYKNAMKGVMEEEDVQLGEFHNIIVENDWGAIRYSVCSTNRKTGVKREYQVKEFVHFKDNPEPIGARVIEGWA